MSMDFGPQYGLDDPFKAAARLHQSWWRADVLQVGWCAYGNRLNEADGRRLLNYYPGLGVREALAQRYAGFSAKRDCDLLRSEHIPFNLLAPLSSRPALMLHVLSSAFGVELCAPLGPNFEWAPAPAAHYLGDLTSFDAYIEGNGPDGKLTGVGIEVKYTERGYRIGKSEAMRVADSDSTYWVVTRESGAFAGDAANELATDELRQIWRNHLLGLAMVRRRDIETFVSVTLYPSGNQHFTHALSRYRRHLAPWAQDSVRGCTFEHLISCLGGDAEVEAWKRYLEQRYLVP